jgi:hypothetical protein
MISVGAVSRQPPLSHRAVNDDDDDDDHRVHDRMTTALKPPAADAACH